MEYIKTLCSKRSVALASNLFVFISVFTSCVFVPTPVTKKPVTSKFSPYRQIDLEEMVRRYIAKTHLEENTIEGIYTVSSEVIKRGKGLLSQEVKDRTVDKKNNYATVAILKDWPGSNTEYVEISLQSDNASKYSIISEISSLSGRQGFIFKHQDKRGKVMPFTFAMQDSGSEVLEGIYTETSGNTTVTYKLSYLKTYPKNKNFTQKSDQ